MNNKLTRADINEIDFGLNSMQMGLQFIIDGATKAGKSKDEIVDILAETLRPGMKAYVAAGVKENEFIHLVDYIYTCILEHRKPSFVDFLEVSGNA